MHIIIANEGVLSDKSVCGLKVETFAQLPARTDRICQKCVLRDILGSERLT